MRSLTTTIASRNFKRTTFSFPVLLIITALLLQFPTDTHNPKITGTKDSTTHGQQTKTEDSLRQTDWYANAIKAIEQSEYHFSKVDSTGTYTTPNRKNNLRFTYDENGFSVSPRITKIPIGKPDLLAKPEEIKTKSIADWKIDFLLDKQQTGEGSWKVSENKAEYITSNITVQYLNNKDGMRQNFIVNKPISNNGKLQVKFSIKTKLKQQFKEDHLQFIHPKEGAVLNYEGLKVWDAAGTELPAKFEKNEQDYAITVDAATAVYPITIDPISKIPIAIIEIDQADAQLGFSIDNAGDVNKDGYNDLVVGAPYYDNGQADEGAVFISHGSPQGLNINFATAQRLEINQAGARMGYSVAGAGDVNNDGYDDVVVGIPYYDNGHTDEGLVYLFYGSPTGLITATPGFHFELNQANAHLGFSVAGAGDVNNDGYDDLIFGAPDYESSLTDQGGVVTALGGASGLTVSTTLVFPQAGARLGYSVSGAGDVNNDGYDDVIAGAPYFDLGSTSNVGLYAVFYGSSTGTSGVGGTFVQAEQAEGLLGFSVSAAGDVDNDGYDDVMAGAPYINIDVNDEGVIQVRKGSAAGINGTTTTTLYINQPGALFGWALDALGDINGDGFDDIAVGAPNYNNQEVKEGGLFIYVGNSTTIGLAALFESDLANAGMGFSVAGVGDVNNDGYPDMVAGAANYSNGQNKEGGIFIFHGDAPTVGNGITITAEGNSHLANMGFSVAGAGDVNGDGYGDIVVGAPNYSSGGLPTGAIFVFYGSASGIQSSSPVILGSGMIECLSGYSVSTGGDINGDGFSDIVAGAPRYGQNEMEEGAILVYYGSAAGIQHAPVVFLGNAYNARLGESVSCAGDINGDGYSDIVSGTTYWSSGQNNEGGVFIFYGSSSGLQQNPTIIESNQAEARIGTSVAGAGDVNGDGYSDVVVGSDFYDNSLGNEGAMWIYYGSATGLNLAGTIIENAVSLSDFGTVVAAAGDANGDGYSDVAVSAPGFRVLGSMVGAVYIYYGSAAGISAVKVSRMESDKINSSFGSSLASAGDYNGDGYADLIVGAQYYSNGANNEGAAYIYKGSPTGISSVPEAIYETNLWDINLYSVSSAGDVNGDGYSDIIMGLPKFAAGDAREGGIFVLHGGPDAIGNTSSVRLQSNQASAEMGYSIANAGDVNGDGFSDVLIGAPQYDLGQYREGIVQLFIGTANGLSMLPSTLQRNMVDARFGSSVAAAGDVNGDGLGDVIIGAPGYNNGQLLEGAAFVYYGSTGGFQPNPTVLEGNQEIAFFGFAVSSAGDANGDGLSDVIIGAPFYDNGQADEGVAFVHYGTPSGINSNGWILENNQTNAFFGGAVSNAGDINGDGRGDVIVGAPYHNNGQAGEGIACIFYGLPVGFIGTPDLILESNQADANFGSAVACAGDVDGNGFNDLMVSATMYDNGQSNEGAVFIYHVSSTGINTTPARVLEIDQASVYFGEHMSPAGDVNGDGYSDIIIGTTSYSNGQYSEGAAFIYLGSATGIGGTASRIIESNQDGAWMGSSVSGGGDVNGDGFSDILIGASRFDQGETDEGSVFIHYGNALTKANRNNIDLYNTDLTSPINRNNISDKNYGAGLFAKSFLGRSKAKMVWETKKNNEPFSGTPITNNAAFSAQQNSYTDAGLSGIELKSIVPKTSGPLTRMRARVKYNPATAITGQLYGPWRYVPEQISGASAGVLPVYLVSFNAEWKQLGQSAKISFITDNESLISQYEIEKSTDGTNFAKIGEVAAKNTAGKHHYSYTDNDATAAKQYYRLKIIHHSGPPEYSRISLLKTDKAGSISVFPNPATDVVNLRLSNLNGKVNIAIVNSSGQTVKQLNNITASNQVIQIRVSDLPAGLYYLSADINGERELLRFMKQ